MAMLGRHALPHPLDDDILPHLTVLANVAITPIPPLLATELRAAALTK